MSYTFNHYILTHPINAQKSGHYQAYPINEPTHRVLLKIFDAASIVPTATLDDFQQMERRLRLLKHSHIAATLELGIEQGSPYVVSEYLSGGSLRQYLNSYSPNRLTLQEAVGVTMQIGRAVIFAHMYKIFHQDIRPEHILLDEQGKVLLTNFSLGSIISETKSTQTPGANIVGYQAPEYLTGAARDLYALGCLLYELTTGTLPFAVTDLFSPQHGSMLTLPIAPSALVPTLPQALEKVIQRALTLQPGEGYADVATFLAALKVALRPQSLVFPPIYQMGKKEEDESFPLLKPSASFVQPEQHKEPLPGLPPSLWSPNDPWFSAPEPAAIAQQESIQDENPLLLDFDQADELYEKQRSFAQDLELSGADMPMDLAFVAGSFGVSPDMSWSNQLSDEVEAVPEKDQDFGVDSFNVSPDMSWSNQLSDEVEAVPEKVSPPMVLDTENKGNDGALASDAQIISDHADSAQITPRSVTASRAAKWKWPIALLAAVLVTVIIATLLMQGTLFTTTKAANTVPASTPSTALDVTPQPTTMPTLQPTTRPTAHTTARPTVTPKPGKGNQTTAPPVTSPTPAPPTPYNVAPIGRLIWLKANINGDYASAELSATNAPLQAVAHSVSTWETFLVVDAGNGNIGLQSSANSMYVNADPATTHNPLIAQSSTLGASESFRWVDAGNGHIALQSVANNHYVSTRIDTGNTPMRAEAFSISTWELLQWGLV